MSSSSSDHAPPPHSGHWNPLVDEIRWVIQIRHTLDEDHDDDEADGIPVSIFNVPRPLLQSKPEAYLPQMIALGPYHHWRQELYEMERYKLSAAKRVHKRLGTAKFQDLVDALGKHERLIRAHYHRYLNFNGDTLSWMMAVDACFLLEFLQIYTAAADDDMMASTIPSRMSHLVDLTGRKSAHNTILRDIMMMENQIPLFLLRKILGLRRDADALPADETLKKMVAVFTKELSPLKMADDYSPPAADETTKNYSHLLEMLYRVLVPKEEKQEESDIEEEGPGGYPSRGWLGQEQGGDDSSNVKQLSSVLWQMMSNMKDSKLVHSLKKVMTSKPMMFVVKAPWKILSTVPGFTALKKPMESLLSSAKEEADKKGDPSLTKKPPLVEEIMVPSVSELVSSGVQFRPTHGDLTTVAFDAKTATFSLPVVCLDSNTEAVLRNLVAYEASAASGPLVLARYTELMNGIIDTADDVRLLRERGMVVNRMKSDVKAAELWNGMNRSVRLTKVECMDRAIEGVNRYHGGRWRVKGDRFMRKYVFGSWPLLTFLAAVVMLLLTALQAFCSVYSCSRWFHDVPIVSQQQP